MKSSSQNHEEVRTWALLLIAALITLSAIYFVRSILFPIALALLIALALRPLVRFFKERKVPEFVSAIAILLVLLGAFIFGVLALAAPATNWKQNAPRHLLDIQHKLRFVKSAVQEIGDAAQQIQQITKPEEAPDTTKVSVSETSLPPLVLNATGGMIVSTGIVISTLFVLLAYGDGFYTAISKLAPTHQQQRNILLLTTSIEKMNIVILFMGVLFWGWLWGLGGILIAVPLMAALLIICEHFQSLEPLARFLGSPEPKKSLQSVPVPVV